jgi:hypothetical protein
MHDYEYLKKLDYHLLGSEVISETFGARLQPDLPERARIHFLIAVRITPKSYSSTTLVAFVPCSGSE